jgi:hypothetical protein
VREVNEKSKELESNSLKRQNEAAKLKKAEEEIVK